MFSDTHCHLKYLIDEDKNNAIQVIAELAMKNTPFVQDIGTISDDLTSRVKEIESAIQEIPLYLQGVKKDSLSNSDIEDSDTLIKKARDMLYFSAGIWPSVDEIKNRTESVLKLENQIDLFRKNTCGSSFSNNKLVALGECGLDHHWNPSGVDGRNEEDFKNNMLNNEIELFEMQLELAKKKKLPVIIHSREAFEETLACLKNIGYHSGIIHCYSYGVEEAKAFLNLGWYISFSGSITYTKKRNLDVISDLIRYIPQDRILCETDSPYLAPVPYRGKKNNPVLVEYVYKYIAERIGLSTEKLAQIVYKNTCELFNL
ncbi:MAG: hypothetical protein BKP49_09540 [Treponema sp. CETP13]|nr:MAG: hypothetical protein BKP49_09540 [Treponema sp. CETP13]